MAQVRNTHVLALRGSGECVGGGRSGGAVVCSAFHKLWWERARLRTLKVAQGPSPSRLPKVLRKRVRGFEERVGMQRGFEERSEGVLRKEWEC